MYYGIHRVDMDIPDDYMDLEMLDDMTYSVDLRYVLADLSHGFIRIMDIEGNRLKEIWSSEENNRDFHLYTRLIRTLEPGSVLLAGKPEEIIPDSTEMAAFYRECLKLRIELIFRNTPYLNSSNFVPHLTSENQEAFLCIISNLIKVAGQPQADSDERVLIHCSKTQRLSNALKKTSADES